MIEAVTVEGFRGLRQLEVDGFGRVNLIIGKNNCGKTALMEALLIADDVEDAASAVISLQAWRQSEAFIQDFERFWAPLFWNQDADRGFSVAARTTKLEKVLVAFRKSKAPQKVVTTGSPKSPIHRKTWTIDVSIERGDIKRNEIISSTSNHVTLPSALQQGPLWIGPYRDVTPGEVQRFSVLKLNSREEALLGLLREIDGRLSGVEILSPTGKEAELFARVGPDVPLLPLVMMGDGFQRCFEIGVAVTAEEWPTMFIDEFDNGLHHSILEPIWRWLATISAKRDLQIFATTHSEECIAAACRAFTAANDDGLRVIRLDRLEDRTTATIYDRALVEAATRMDVEIRG